MNPLTLVKRIQNINSKEAALGISEDASWHTKYKESAYVFVGGIPFDLTEGDLLAVFAQYGEIVDVNLVRDKGTGKSKGFAFIAYEDQRSTNLAVDNLNGAQILGRIIRVDHASNYKKKEEEDEEKEQQKREARGVCRAFQRGECNRGAACRFSHNEQRCANTGGGPEDSHSRWDHDKYDGSSRSHGRYSNISSSHIPESKVQEGGSRSRLYGDGARASRAEDDEREMKSHSKRSATSPGEQDKQGLEKQSERKEERRHREHHDRRETERALGRCEAETKPSKDHDRRRREERSGRHELERNPREEDRDRRGDGKRSRYERDSYSHRHREDDKEHHRSSHRCFHVDTIGAAWANCGNQVWFKPTVPRNTRFRKS